MSGLSKLSNTPALIRQVLAGRLLDPAPFVQISNAAADLICDIEICTQLGSLDQIFAEPSVLYKKPTPKPERMPTTTPNKHPRPSPYKGDESELVKKQRKAKKEGWLKKSFRGSFHPPSNLSVQCCSQHIIVSCNCRFQLKNGSCNFQHIEWAALPQSDKVIWSNFVGSTQLCPGPTSRPPHLGPQY
eukprot:10070502-Ditylum_brightwellii.AAC.1